MKHKKYAVILFVFALCCLSACSSDKHKEETTEQVYLNPQGNTIQERVLVPDGYTRVAENEHSFGQFLREYPLKPYGSPILLYDGREKLHSPITKEFFRCIWNRETCNSVRIL